MYTNEMLKNADGFHCVGNQEKESLLKLGVNSDKINIVNNGINLKNYQTKEKTQIEWVDGLYAKSITDESCRKLLANPNTETYTFEIVDE